MAKNLHIRLKDVLKGLLDTRKKNVLNLKGPEIIWLSVD